MMYGVPVSASVATFPSQPYQHYSYPMSAGFQQPYYSAPMYPQMPYSAAPVYGGYGGYGGYPNPPVIMPIRAGHRRHRSRRGYF